MGKDKLNAARKCLRAHGHWHARKRQNVRGEIRKQLTAPRGSLKQAGERWYAAELVMRDRLDESQTVLRVLEVNADLEMKDSDFQPGSFYLSR